MMEETKTYTAQEFMVAFKELCEKMEYQLVAAPLWVARDDGTFSTKIEWTVGKLPKQEKL